MDTVFKETDIRAKQIVQILYYKLSYEQENNPDTILYDNQISNLFLQKFLYFAQTFALKFFNKHLFIDDCEAWKYGPVIPNVYTAFNNYRELLVSPDIFPKLDSFSRFIIDSTLGILKDCSTSQLVAIAHEPGAAWSKCYKENVKHIIIPIESIKQYVPNAFLKLVDVFTKRHKSFDESLVYNEIKSLDFLNG